MTILNHDQKMPQNHVCLISEKQLKLGLPKEKENILKFEPCPPPDDCGQPLGTVKDY